MLVARAPCGEKRKALLDAATEAIASAGIGASTAMIARGAGVAEGTLFRYFATKDVLLNALYLHLKVEFGRSILEQPDRPADSKGLTRYIWDRLIDWGLAHPVAHQAMRQLAISDKITEETEQQVNDSNPELHQMCEKSILPLFLSPPFRRFGDTIFFAMAETTMEFATREPARTEEFKTVGYEAMWRALGRQDV